MTWIIVLCGVVVRLPLLGVRTTVEPGAPRGSPEKMPVHVWRRRAGRGSGPRSHSVHTCDSETFDAKRAPGSLISSRGLSYVCLPLRDSLG